LNIGDIFGILLGYQWNIDWDIMGYQYRLGYASRLVSGLPNEIGMHPQAGDVMGMGVIFVTIKEFGI
jgi:hypothetical protein